MNHINLSANIDGHVTVNLSRVEHIYSVRYWTHTDVPPRWCEVYTGPDKHIAVAEYFEWQRIKLEGIL